MKFRQGICKATCKKNLHLQVKEGAWSSLGTHLIASQACASRTI